MPKSRTLAVDDISLNLFPQSTLALAGKSGSGKSTLARCLAGLEAPDSGEIWFQGQDFLSLRQGEFRRARREVQLVFQHSAAAMNPAFSAVEAVAEPLRIQGMARKRCHEQALDTMEQLGIPAACASRSPLAFSGGQRQRLVLARALLLNPKLMILDEALAGLDIPIQLQIADLLLELQRSRALSYLFISHDLRMAAYLADTIAVLDQGRIVEMASAREVCMNPQCAQTRGLVAAIPKLPKDPGELTDAV